ncbi:MAG: phage baseplate assembly protein V [Anaerolineae bacterium]|nr:phage baseplate assembly protein V [Anaerolineae bacterium]
MDRDAIFERPREGVLNACYLALVESVEDDQNLGRVQVRLLNADGIDGHDGPMWARVAVPFAGPNMGAFFIPNVDDEVLVSFVNGDARFPVVVGSFWNGRDRPSEQIGGNRVDRWAFKGKNGTRVAIVEEGQGTEKIILSTPQQLVSATLDASGSGKIELKITGTSITLDSGGVTITTSASVTVNAPSGMTVTAPNVTVNAATATFSNTVKCTTLIADLVSGKTYTPGAGNLW